MTKSEAQHANENGYKLSSRTNQEQTAMRALLVAGLPLALGTALPANAATNTSNLTAVQNIASAFSGEQTVRVVEHFENGAVAMVDVMPGGQYRIAQSGGEEAALIV